MEVKAGFKQTDIGVYPNDWNIVDYISVAQIIDGDRGVNYPAANDFHNSGHCLFLNAGNVTKTGFQFSDCQFITTEKDKKLRKGKLIRGDCVLTTRGTIGNFAFFSDDVPFDNIRINSGMVVLRKVTTNINSEYHYTVLRSLSISSQLERLSFGSAQPQLTVKGISTLKIPLPSLPEQTAIAETLSDADALIAALEDLIAKKRLVKQGAMQELLTGNRRLPGFSGEWKVKPLGNLFYISGGLSASRDQLSSNGHCYLHYGDIHLSKKTFIDVKSEFQEIPKLDTPLSKVSPVSLLNDGDIVFVDASEDDEGASKHVVVVNPDGIPYISGLHTIVAKSKTEELDHLYRRYCFQTRVVKKQFLFYSVGTKVTGISKTNIAKITLSFPPIPEQTAIAEILSDMDAEIAALEAKLSKAWAVKQGMMSVLLTGKVRLIGR